MEIPNSRVLITLGAQGQTDPAVVGALALQIFLNSRIQLARVHVSGVCDRATARHNAVHHMFGFLARRSQYQNAPGGMLSLDVRMMRALLELARHYSFAVSELAGGSHKKRSAHYVGVAFDVNLINGKRVSAAHPDCGNFMRDCRQLGAKVVIGPPAKGHETHIHAEWPPA